MKRDDDDSLCAGMPFIDWSRSFSLGRVTRTAAA
jgi:hypothetical protein